MTFCHSFENKNLIRHSKITECTNFEVKDCGMKLYEKSFEDNCCGMIRPDYTVHTIVGMMYYIIMEYSCH